MCEGCRLKAVPHYGLPAERRRRWCAGCAAAEGRGAVHHTKWKVGQAVGRAAIGDSLSLQAAAAGPPPTKKAAVAGSANAPPRAHGAVNAGCAKKSHPGAVASSRKEPTASAPRPRALAKTRPSKRHKVTKMCEGCGIKVPNYGLSGERRKRWCAGCAAAKGNGSVRLDKQKSSAYPRPWARAVAVAQVQVARRNDVARGLVPTALARDAITVATELVQVAQTEASANASGRLESVAAAADDRLCLRCGSNTCDPDRCATISSPWMPFGRQEKQADPTARSGLGRDAITAAMEPVEIKSEGGRR